MQESRNIRIFCFFGYCAVFGGILGPVREICVARSPCTVPGSNSASGWSSAGAYGNSLLLFCEIACRSAGGVHRTFKVASKQQPTLAEPSEERFERGRGERWMDRSTESPADRPSERRANLAACLSLLAERSTALYWSAVTRAAA